MRLGNCQGLTRVLARLAASKRDQERLADVVQAAREAVNAWRDPVTDSMEYDDHVEILQRTLLAIDAAQGEQPKGSRVAGDQPKEEGE
jgi:hypothetical protein